MPDHNFNVKVLVDVQGKKVMDDLAKGAGTSSPATTGTTTGSGERGVGSTLQSLIGAITPLTAAIGVGVGILGLALANSQVLSKIMGTVGKMLGFMLDIVLLPLMPLIMGLMRFMWSMILAFRDFTKKTQEKGFLGISLDILAPALMGPVGSFISWLLQWLWNEQNKGFAKGGIEISFTGLLDPIMEWFKGLGNGWDITVNFVKGALQWLYDLVATLLRLRGEQEPATFEGGPAGMWTDKLVSTGDTVNENYFKPKMKVGGGSQPVTFIFNGLSDDKLVAKIKDTMWKEGKTSMI